MRHRRLALRGSPATARGCGELWRALLAAAVAVSETKYEIDRKNWGKGQKSTENEVRSKRPRRRLRTNDRGGCKRKKWTEAEGRSKGLRLRQEAKDQGKSGGQRTPAKAEGKRTDPETKAKRTQGEAEGKKAAGESNKKRGKPFWFSS